MKRADHLVLLDITRIALNSFKKYSLTLIILLGLFTVETTAKPENPTKFLRSMARLCIATENLDRAQKLIEKAVNISESTETDDYEKSLCLVDLAYVYSKQNKLDKAGELCLQAVQLQKQAYGSEDIAIAYTLKILAPIQRRQAKFHQATESIDQAIGILKINNEPTHTIAIFQIELARIYADQNRLEDSEKLYEGCLKNIFDSYGQSHLYTAKVMTEFADVLLSSKKYDHAHKLVTQSLHIQKEIYGSDHCNMIPAWITLSEILKQKYEFAQVILILENALNIAEKQQENKPHLKLQVLKAMSSLYIDNFILAIVAGN